MIITKELKLEYCERVFSVITLATGSQLTTCSYSRAVITTIWIKLIPRVMTVKNDISNSRIHKALYQKRILHASFQCRLNAIKISHFSQGTLDVCCVYTT
jgi:hypothetical protein